jgi:hypothetical protein
MSWELSRLGKEFYAVEIVTDPQLNSWEASFDYGLSWHPMIDDTEQGVQRVLVAGPEAVNPMTAVVLQSNVAPLIRSISDPEVIVRTAPTIILV